MTARSLSVRAHSTASLIFAEKKMVTVVSAVTSCHQQGNKVLLVRSLCIYLTLPQSETL